MIVCEIPWIMLKFPVGGTSYGHAEWNSLFPGLLAAAGAVVGWLAAAVGCPAAAVGCPPAVGGPPPLGFGVSVALLLPQAASATAAAAPAVTARKRRRVTFRCLISSLLM